MDTCMLILLRSFVQGTRPELPAQVDFSELWQCAARQGVLPILGYLDLRWCLFEDPEYTERLRSVLFSTVAASVNRRVDFEALSTALTQSGIAHMPVKGYYLSALYPVPELRTSGDIDILIHPDDRARADALMRTHGYTATHAWEPTYVYVRGAECYELHTNLMDGDLDARTDLQAFFSGAWQYAVPETGLRYAPSLDYHFLYTVCHLAKHLYSGGAGLRMYLDVALYLQAYDAQLNWDLIAGWFAELGLTTFFHTVMQAVCTWFGVTASCPLPEPDTELLAQLLTYTLAADLFGHLREHAVILRRNAAENSKGTAIRQMLFPPAAQIERRYTFLQGRHWLLPLAWAVRPFANLQQIPRRLRDMYGVSRIQTADVAEYDRFMQQIGL